jgi:hypothetical protein
MEYYSAIKNNEILLFTGNWIELENILLSEVTQVQKDICLLSYVEDRSKYKQCHIYIYIYTEHVSNRRTVRGEIGDEGKKRMIA